MTRSQIAILATQAGFGGQQRITLAVKLERFADLVRADEVERVLYHAARLGAFTLKSPMAQELRSISCSAPTAAAKAE